MAAVSSPAARYAHQTIVDDALWERLVARIAREQCCDTEFAARIMDQALGFLRLIAQEPEAQYAPSPTVDLGWHALILYTREYAALCERLAGRFIHHTPDDDPAVVVNTSVPRTVAAMKVRGLLVDDELWYALDGECGGQKCHTCVE